MIFIFSLDSINQDINLIRTIQLINESPLEGEILRAKVLQPSITANNKFVFFTLVAPSFIKKYEQFSEKPVKTVYFINPLYNWDNLINVFDITPVSETTLILGCLGGLIIMYDF